MWAEFRHPILLCVWPHHTLLQSRCRPTAYLKYRRWSREGASHDFIQLLWHIFRTLPMMIPWNFVPSYFFFFSLISVPMRKRMSLPGTIVIIAREKSPKYDGTLEIQQEVIAMCAHLYICACYFAPWTYILLCKPKHNSNFNFWIHSSITNYYRNYVIGFHKCY